VIAVHLRAFHYAIPTVHAVRKTHTSTKRYAGSIPDRRPMQVVGISAIDLNGRNFTDAKRTARGYVNRAIDIRRVALAAAFGDRRADFVDNDLLAGADLAFEAFH
jgi:hypothetical protein